MHENSRNEEEVPSTRNRLLIGIAVASFTSILVFSLACRREHDHGAEFHKLATTVAEKMNSHKTRILTWPEQPRVEMWYISSCWTVEVGDSFCSDLASSLDPFGLNRTQALECSYNGMRHNDLLILEFETLKGERLLRACLTALAS